MSNRTSRLLLPGTIEAVGRARRTVTEVLRHWGFRDSAWLDTVTLIVAELVSNALRHAGGRITVDLHIDGQLIVGVTDTSPVPPRLVEPDDRGGRGLLIVDALCPRWGVREHGTGKQVWAELPPAPLGGGTR